MRETRHRREIAPRVHLVSQDAQSVEEATQGESVEEESSVDETDEEEGHGDDAEEGDWDDSDDDDDDEDWGDNEDEGSLLEEYVNDYHCNEAEEDYDIKKMVPE